MEIDDIVAQSSFSMLKGKIDSRILEALSSMGLEKPTRIQAETLPYLLQQNDLIGAAKTGSGKTLAFLIPVVDNLIKLRITRKHGNILLSTYFHSFYYCYLTTSFSRYFLSQLQYK